MRVKICGITRIQDALAAQRYGADAIGVVVCSDSPRCVELSTAGTIFSAIGPFMARVAVTHTSSLTELDAILQLRPDAIQISHPFILSEENRGVRVLRVVGKDTVDLPACDAYVVDESRGSGIVYDPAFARALIARSRVPVILAGGLTAENVASAIAVIQPYAVDVASGVETAPGVKDPARIQAFIRACREGYR
ncbi:MAG: phosphoribosylanthranilate isomerase [Methanomicrobiales archaeon]|nr:phosphoribosylanthranilate isomerase [Methanomicrobiales archaeon]